MQLLHGHESEDGERIDPVGPQALLLRLVVATVTARIRHRALLEVLGSGPFDYERYLETYRELRERDYQALFAQYMLRKSDFGSLFGDWQAEDIARYRVDRGPEAELERDMPRKPARKPPRRKKNSGPA